MCNILCTSLHNRYDTVNCDVLIYLYENQAMDNSLNIIVKEGAVYVLRVLLRQIL